MFNKSCIFSSCFVSFLSTKRIIWLQASKRYAIIMLLSSIYVLCALCSNYAIYLRSFPSLLCCFRLLRELLLFYFCHISPPPYFSSNKNKLWRESQIVRVTWWSLLYKTCSMLDLRTQLSVSHYIHWLVFVLFSNPVSHFTQIDIVWRAISLAKQLPKYLDFTDNLIKMLRELSRRLFCTHWCNAPLYIFSYVHRWFS